MVDALDSRAASIGNLRPLAQSRLPKFAYEYLCSGCITDSCLARNRYDLDQVTLAPRYLPESGPPDLSCTILGKQYSLPLGIAPIGLSGLVWPESAEYLASAAQQSSIPFVLSTVASTSIERAAECAGDNFWFQLYPPPDEAIRKDLMDRVGQSGCEHLVVTIDVPALGRRPRDIQNGIGLPPSITVKNILQTAVCPAWTIQTIRHGIPKFANLERYLEHAKDLQELAYYVRSTLKDIVDLALLKKIRSEWPHKLIVKGILSKQDASLAIDAGADAIWVSNHGGRQLDTAPSSLSVLQKIAEATAARTDIIVDSGVESGVDVSRFLAHGAQMVFAGRAFMYGVAALGQAGAQHAIDILEAELLQTMIQLRCSTATNLAGNLTRIPESGSGPESGLESEHRP